MGRRILVVDDEPELILLVEILLDSIDCEMISASSSAEALEKLKDEEIDLLLLDIVLPDTDGWELLDEIKKNEKLKDLPIIVFTAKVEDERDMRYIEEYNLTVIKKPFNSHELMHLIDGFPDHNGTSD